MTIGTCLCGTVRYEVDGPFQMMMHCHCSMCRKHHGSTLATFVSAPLSGFRWLSGEDAITRYQSSPEGSRSFCGNCGSVTPVLMPAAGVVVCPAGNLQGDLGLEPQAHIFTGSKAVWDTITDTLPQHAEYPPEFHAAGIDRPAPAVPTGITQGSCLCGDVAYEITGEPLRMVSCHCSRCRLGRSAAYATNVFYKDTQFAWTRGASQAKEYRVPDAKYFAVAFCTRCGSGVPRISVERGLVVVPAGSLDSDPGIRPQMHIFVESRAPWDSIADTLPQFAAGPT
jgi:hypothetical protein